MDITEELVRAIRALEEAVFNDPTLALEKDLSGLLLLNYVAGITNELDRLEREKAASK